MKRNFTLLFSLIPVFFITCNAQNKTLKVFETKNDWLKGRLEIKFCSEDVLKFDITLESKIDNQVIKMNNYAIIPNLNDQKKYGLDYQDGINPPGRSLGVRQFQTICKCENWFNFKVPKDTSVISVECDKTVIDRLKGVQKGDSRQSYFLDYFYLIKD